MDFRYQEKFQDTLGRYRYFASLYQEENSVPVPGLRSTDILGNPCTQMVPQGICIAGDYMLVTAYDSGTPYQVKPGQRSRKVNKSVLYVLSNQGAGSRELLVTVVLPDINHVGGVALTGRTFGLQKALTGSAAWFPMEPSSRPPSPGQAAMSLPVMPRMSPAAQWLPLSPGTVASYGSALTPTGSAGKGA